MCTHLIRHNIKKQFSNYFTAKTLQPRIYLDLESFPLEAEEDLVVVAAFASFVAFLFSFALIPNYIVLIIIR